MTTDLEFTTAADEFMAQVFETLADLDPDELDVDLAMGVLTMEFADGTKCIMNRQTAAHQIWLAHRATAWHFALEQGQWLDTKGRGELAVVLASLLGERLARQIEL